jgi:type II secretory pathway component PulM
MMGQLASWFSSRTQREQLLLQAGVAIAILAALWLGWQTAAGYRASAAADLASAMQLRDDVARLRAVPVAARQTAPSDGTARGAVTAIATQFNLSPSRIEPDGPTAVRISFQPSASQNLYAWINAVERAGFAVSRITIIRAGEGDVVQADASVSARRP